ncbi:MAG: aminopeptidase P family protein [Bacteroidales bacterium]|nr:aminopeptidase P family protein [Bacteroidales bacterium]MCM1147227.1 aminopeptidase P family protein [Bacteroidales bacterium]MCM1207238.1 aminopeptidase P family protein [Bacillota bacterium]MCM1509743.1 aminopeptidase P family protein [Clostridium sp.]
MDTTKERLAALRTLMTREKLCAVIIPSTDPHNGEYVPEHWEGRKWISGFSGSAGTAVVTMDSAALWTDSRYFIQAEEELKDTEYKLMKLGMPGTPDIPGWISGEVFGNGIGPKAVSTEVCIDGTICSAAAVEELVAQLRAGGGLTLRTNLDPLAAIWEERPSLPDTPVEIHPIELAGESAGEKLARIRRMLRRQHADGMIVAALDDIAWTLNIRGNDVHCTPVAVAYLIIASDRATLFINKGKVSGDVEEYLRSEGVEVDEYRNITDGLQRYPEYNILADKRELNYSLYKTIKCRIVDGTSPIPSMKSVKSAAEIAGFRNAMLRDGVALARFTRWLKENIGKIPMTELSVCDRLRSLRAEQKLFRDLSFDTIAGYGAHGAIVHYEPSEKTDVPLEPHGFLLLDSGAQYRDGTTDITRTIPLGPLTDEERLVYTLVLKGHINLEMLKFPDGASGTQLDAVARRELWKHGYNFLHGTGHGVGSYLSVHEGPHQIRMEYRPAPLHAGMTVTDEPGVYLEGKFGVRIENTLLTRKYITPLQKAGRGHESPTAEFLEFETLTLCPIDTEPILTDMLNEEERKWINDYHRHVFSSLSPLLSPEDREWLRKACEAL